MQSLGSKSNYLWMILSISSVFMFFISCSQKSFDSEQQLLEFLQDEVNDYKQHKTVNGVDFSLMYRPTDLLVKQEIGNSSMPLDSINMLRDKYKHYIYFNLSMSKNGQELLSAVPKNRNEFGSMVNQLVFGMHEKIHLLTQQNDTIELVDYVYPRMYGMSKTTSMMFVYPREKQKLDTKKLQFTIEDLGLQTGEVKFTIDTDKIINEPNLKF